jgi:hypothetical protein
LDSEGLASSSLAVCEYGSIVSFQAAVSNGSRNLSEYDFLLQVFVPNEVEVEHLLLWLLLNDDSVLVFNGDALLGPAMR